MNGKNKQATLLENCLAKPASLSAMIDYAEDSVVSKTIIDKPIGTITLFSFDAGQKLSEHTAPYDAVIQVFEGNAVITIGGKKNVVSAGQIIIMPANVPHAVDAEEKFKMLLIMIRA